LQFIRLTCGWFINDIAEKHKMCWLKRANSYFQQHNKQYQITIKSVILSGIHVEIDLWRYVKLAGNQSVWLKMKGASYE
jgi:hypothetical protein